MEYVIGLDLSSKTGISVFKNGSILNSQTIELGYKVDSKDSFYPFNFINATKDMSEKLIQFILEYPNSTIVIEETSTSRNVYAQKKLEFLHYQLLNDLDSYGFYKINYLGSNKWRSILNIKQTPETTKHNKLVKAGKAKGKITTKHLSVYSANKIYGLSLLQKDNNESDAIHLAAAYLQQHGELKHDYNQSLQGITDR